MVDVRKQLSKFRKKEIDTLFQTTKAVYKSKELVILTAPCLLSFGRILLVTSRKVGNAPKRNLLRRRSRSIFYQEKLFENKHDFVVIFKAPATKMSFDELKEVFVQSMS